MVASLRRSACPIAVFGLAVVGSLSADVNVSKHVPVPNARGASLGACAAVRGDWAVVGAPNASGATANSGAAYVFARVDDTWSQTDLLTAFDGAATDLFGRSVALSADWLAVGAPEDDSPTNSGSVYLFRNVSGVWQFHSKLTAADRQSNDYFGTCVGLEGEWLLVGAPNQDGAGFNSGAVYVYRFDAASDAWTQSAKLQPGLPGDLFGTSLAVRGDVAAIGALGDDGMALNAGAVHVYRLMDGVWLAEETLRGSDSQASDDFGASVAVGQDRIVVGAPRDNEGLYVDTGAAFVFHYDGAWSEEFKYVSADASASDFLGRSVAIDADMIVVGSPAEDAAGTNAGAVYLLHRVDGQWVAEPRMVAADAAAFDAFGTALSLEGDALFMGATGDDDSGDGAGAVYAAIFAPANLAPICSAGALYEAECDGSGASVALDGSGSVDPDGDPIQFQWTSDCPGATFDDPTSPRPILSLRGGCSTECSVTLSVSDGVNPPVSCPATVRVVDTTPPELTCPPNAEIFDGDDASPEALGLAIARDCDPAVRVDFEDEVDPSDCLSDTTLSKTRRRWIATDACGNSTSQTQIIRRSRRVLLMDVKPGACPNSFVPGSGGSLPVLIFGDGSMDTSSIDVSSLRISRADCEGTPLAPIAAAPKMKDSGSPKSPDACACHSSKPDRLVDMQISFDSRALTAALELSGTQGSVMVAVTGVMYTADAPEGAAFMALDCLNIVGATKEERGGGAQPAPQPVDPCATGMAPGLFLTAGMLLAAKGRRRTAG